MSHAPTTAANATRWARAARPAHAMWVDTPARLGNAEASARAKAPQASEASRTGASPVPVTRAVGLALGALTVLCWASFNVAAVHGIESGLTPLDLTLLRFGTAGLVLGAALALLRLRASADATRHATGVATDNASHPLPTLPNPRRALVLAVLGGPLFGVVSVGGYLYAPLSHGMVFAPAAVFAGGTALAVILNGERVRAGHWVGGGIAVLGLGILAGVDVATLGAQTLLGDALFVAAGLMWALFTALQRCWNIHPIGGVLAIGTASGLLAPLVFGVGLLFGFPSGLAGAGAGEIALQALMQGFVGGVVSIAALIAAARLLGTATAALLPSFTPALALVIAIPALGDVPGTNEIAGTLDAVAGLTLAVRAGTTRQ